MAVVCLSGVDASRLILEIFLGDETQRASIEVELYHEANQVLVFDLTSGR